MKKTLSIFIVLCFLITSICIIVTSAVSPDDDNVIPIGNINFYWIPKELEDEGYELGNVANIYTTPGATLNELCVGDYLQWWHVGVFEWDTESSAYVLTRLELGAEGTQADKGVITVPENGIIVATNGGMNDYNNAHSMFKEQEIGVKAYLFGEYADKDLTSIESNTNLLGKLYVSIGVDPNPNDENSSEEDSEETEDPSEETEDPSEEDEEETSSKDNPKTSDTGITAMIIIALITLAGAVYASVKRR